MNFQTVVRLRPGWTVVGWNNPGFLQQQATHIQADAIELHANRGVGPLHLVDSGRRALRSARVLGGVTVGVLLAGGGGQVDIGALGP